VTRPRTRLCPICSGTGRIEIYRPPFLRPCRTCGGSGRLPAAPNPSVTKGVDPVENHQQNEAQAVKHDI
jgi:DnaJ-class molecular chaperone